MRRFLAVGMGVLGMFFLVGGASALAAISPTVTIKPVGTVTSTTVQVSGTVDPNGGPMTVWDFQYSKDPEVEGWTPSALSGVVLTPAVEEVSGTVEGLQPNASYQVRLVATNEETGEGVSAEPNPSFTTKPAPPKLDGESVSGVSSHEGTLEAQVNPNNRETTYSFEYSKTEAAGELTGTITTVKGAAALNGYPDQPVSVSTGAVLTQLTTYYWRVVAENAQSKVEGKPAEGNIEHFKTLLEAPTTSPATGIEATSAKLHGILNPNAAGELGSYEFRYRASASECEGELGTPAGSMTGVEGQGVEAELTGLEPGKRYTFCLFAKDAAEETAIGAPVTFTTQALPPAIAAESTAATEVTATSAKLNAQVDPGGAQTTYHFEYATSPYTTSAPHGQSTPESAPVGADNSEHAVFAAIQGLQPGTHYHYRIVATSSAASGGVAGPDRTFTTQSPGAEFALPDNRGYELVSPPEKDGGEVLGPGGASFTPAYGDATQAAEDGGSVSYITTAPVGAGSPGNSLSSQIFSTRRVGGGGGGASSSGGWSSQNISIPHPNPVLAGGGFLQQGEEFMEFSSDLSRAIVMTPHATPEPPLAPEIHQEVGGATTPAGQEIYVRNNATGVFQAVQTVEPLPLITFEGASADLSHVVFEGPAGLDPKYPTAGGLYEWAGGHTQLVSVLPGTEPASGLSLLGRDYFYSFGMILSATMHSVSDDGSRVVWSSEAGNLYTRDTVTEETTSIGPGGFETATSDGSRVFYDNNGELFMFDVADGTPTDLGVTEPPSHLGNRSFREPFVGVSEEGTTVYEFSPAVLTPVANGKEEKASPGAKNLYVLHEAPKGGGSWKATFITAGAEEGAITSFTATTAVLARQELRASPDGRFIAFMSRQSPTGYDNRDANSGQPDEEVYLYDAETNRLVCASCDPTGARPVGEYEPEEVFPLPPLDRIGLWHEHGLAASIPGWTPNGDNNTTGSQPRSVSNSGQLFFDSKDALVPQDINGRVDVYEYEPDGVGSCVAPGFGLSASVVHDLAGSGCVGLISAGTGSDDSIFFDASANGSDVFFTTEDGLVPQDKDGASDMYDARVCTQAEPCLQSPVPVPPCTTADSCRSAPSPQPGLFGASGSATFAGAGNTTPAVGGAPNPPKKATKKTVRCKKNLVKNNKGKCARKKSKKRAKGVSRDRRAKR